MSTNRKGDGVEAVYYDCVRDDDENGGPEEYCEEKRERG